MDRGWSCAACARLSRARERGDHGGRAAATTRSGYARVTGRAPLDFSMHVNRHPSLVTDTQRGRRARARRPRRRAAAAQARRTARVHRQPHLPHGAWTRLPARPPVAAGGRAYRAHPWSWPSRRRPRRRCTAWASPRDRIEVLAPGVDRPADRAGTACGLPSSLRRPSGGGEGSARRRRGDARGDRPPAWRDGRWWSAPAASRRGFARGSRGPRARRRRTCP